MKHHLLLFSLFFLSYGCYAQPKTVRQYYYWTNQAELAICDSNFQRANECFAKAFTYKFPFANHLRTAYHLNTHITHDEENILQYAYQLCQRGDGEYAVAEYRRNDSCDTQLLGKLQDMADTTRPSYDILLQRKLEKIIETDQSFIHQIPASTKEDSLNKSNLESIKDIYQRYSHVNENTAGQYYWHYLGTPALHYVQAGSYSLQKILRKQVNKGDFSSYEFMSLEDEYHWRKRFNKNTPPQDPNRYAQGHYYCFEMSNTLFINYPANVRKVNRNRKKLGIAETFEEMVTKRIWEFKHRLYWHPVNHRRYGTEEDTAREAAKMKQEIDAEHAAGDFSRMYYDRENTSDNVK